MIIDTNSPRSGRRFQEKDCNIDEFVALISQQVDPSDYPHASTVRENVLVYDAQALENLAPAAREAVQDELVTALLTGPGIVVFEGAFSDVHALDEASQYFTDTIARQHAAGSARGDHFAAPGANDRIWSALQKLAVAEPGIFTDYYANEPLALICEAWLGPMYQVTSSVNVVNPGGAAQSSHRDYHLGLLTPDVAVKFRAHIHRLSPALTLQGAIAHCEMPIESGPTMYLPFSQQYEPGYLASTRPEFRKCFEQNYVQLPLHVGDAVFFNPALIHAAGHNTSSDIYRMANLLQVSSAFGRPMDTIDRAAVVDAIYPHLRLLAAAGHTRAVRNVIAAAAEGYAFPTDLDLDQPLTGMAGETQAELLGRALADSVSPQDLRDLLADHSRRHGG